MKKIFYLAITAALVLCSCEEEKHSTFHIYGTLSLSGEPIASREIQITEQSPIWDVLATTVTGSDGYFSFDNIAPHSIGFDSFGTEFYFIIGGKRSHDLSLHIEANSPKSIKRDIDLKAYNLY